MPLLDKLTKSGTLRSNVCPKRGFLLLNGPKCGFKVKIVRIGWLGSETRPGKRGRRDRWWRMSQLFITR